MKKWILVAIAASWPASVLAIPVSVDFSGVDLTVRGEFINAVPVPPGDIEFAPLFQAGKTVTGSISFDTSQPDVDPDPNVGTYRIGALAAMIPELGLSIARSSSSMQISSFNDTANPDDQFFGFVDGVDTFVNSVGIPDPVSFSILLFGNTSMLADDLLPTGNLDWTFGNLSFDILASDGTKRQVLLDFSPASVPEPMSLSLLILGLTGMVFRQRRSRP